MTIIRRFKTNPYELIHSSAFYAPTEFISRHEPRERNKFSFEKNEFVCSAPNQLETWTESEQKQKKITKQQSTQ